VAVSETGAISCNTHEKCYVFNGKMMIDHQIFEYCALFPDKPIFYQQKLGGLKEQKGRVYPTGICQF
jgi:hypothetical protein